MQALARTDRLRRRFAVTQVVRLGGLVGTIAACDYTFAGREIYTVKFDCAERPVRRVMGEYLHALHDTRETIPLGDAVLPSGRALRLLPQIHQVELLAA